MFLSDEKAVEVIHRSRMTKEDFRLIKVIGRGAFGEVQLVSVTANLVGRILPRVI